MSNASDSDCISQNTDTYRVGGWGRPYFSINPEGHLEVHPNPNGDCRVDLYQLSQQLEARGLSLPVLVRFPDILDHRISRINGAFAKAIEEYKYGGRYQGVFPVKVNQQRHLVEEVVEYGRAWGHGLEAGSKPELLIALSLMHDTDGLVICNGYKDLSYVETALLGQRIQHTVIVVLERVEELDLVFEASKRLGIRPVLGVRAKLSSKGIGPWEDSAGDRAKFGLSAAEIVLVVDRLKEQGMLSCLQLVHFHIGSQVSNISTFKNALREATRFYVELFNMGAPMKYMDVGGGLAVDYDGSRTDFHASKNYDTQEYAYDVVAAIQEACDRAKIPPATIVSESGRATVAHQSVLVFDVLGSNQIDYALPNAPEEDAHSVIQELYETWSQVTGANIQESWHDATQAREEAQSLFKFGYLSLRERARVDRLFWHCANRIAEAGRTAALDRPGEPGRDPNFVPEEMEDIEKVRSAVYYSNFSVFRSAPDTWAIDQLFPIMPIHRLNEIPTKRARLADLTCDSDGIIDHFIDKDDVKDSLEVHALKQGERYMMGMFLVGAYQEILGDLHNLFGDTHAVHVRVGPRRRSNGASEPPESQTSNGSELGYHVEHVVKGDRTDEVLSYVQYDAEAMVERVRHRAEDAFEQGNLTLEHMGKLMEHFEKSLRAYTYLSV